MAKQSNVFSQGNGGGSFETEVQTSFLISFLLGLHLPGGAGVAQSLRQQASSLGYLTDDLVLTARNNDHQTRILCQIKHSLIISEKGKEFNEVLTNAWLDYSNKNLFDPNRDKIFIIKADLTLDEKKHLNILLDWARAKSSEVDFLIEINRIKSKKYYYDIFFSIIKQSKENLSNKEIFAFFKSLYILEMDFGSAAGLQKPALLSLVDRYKLDPDQSAFQLWALAYEFIGTGNSKGQQIDRKNIPEGLKGYFELNPTTNIVSEIQRLSRQNLEIIESMSDTISGYSLQRPLISESASEILQLSGRLIITGEPGTGKSALAKKSILSQRDGKSGLILSFRADELGKPSLRDYFSEKGIFLTLEEIYSYFAMCEYNLIYIDAIEKLLESTGTAIVQLFEILNKLPNTKLIITARQSDLSLLSVKYPELRSCEQIIIPLLEDSELDLITEELPKLKPFTENKKLRQLLKTPKYLDFSYNALKSNIQMDSAIDEQEFREILWDCIIENKLNESGKGMPQYRKDIFLHIAVSRAQLMMPYVQVDNFNPEALEKLLKENVILRKDSTDLYAPAHDILEDWALVRYVDGFYAAKTTKGHFFENLGVSPAMRRAYRLWVSATLRSAVDAKINFISAAALEGSSIDAYWRDESMIGILQSEFCEPFFKENQNSLKGNGFELFKRFLHILRMACRENVGDLKSKKYFPIGRGWAAVIDFIHSNLDHFPSIMFRLLFSVLQEWTAIIPSNTSLPASTRKAGLSILYMLNKHFIPEGNKDELELIVRVLCTCVGGIVPEIKSLLNIEDTEQSGDWIDDWDESLKSLIISNAVSGKHSQQFAQFMPSEVIELARNKWLLLTCEVEYPDSREFMPLSRIISQRNEKDVNEHYGLKKFYRSEYFPPSGLQTPLKWLLQYHQEEALTFIIELLNWSTQNYLYSDFSDEDKPEFIELIFADGTTVKQAASDPLWEMHRGAQKITPYLLQSVLMALENYMLQLADIGEQSRTTLNHIVLRILTESLTVATTAVVSSIYQAYPNLCDKYISVLISNRKILKMDKNRFLGDMTKYELGSEDRELDLERHNSNKLPHRKAYYAGLESFITHYCFNFGAANESIFKMMDLHRKRAGKKDFAWLRSIDEMDTRTWSISAKIETEQGMRIEISPTYSKNIAPYVEKLKSEVSKRDFDSEYSLWLTGAETKRQANTIEKWREIYFYYLKISKYSRMYHQPGTLASIGARDLWDELTTEEKLWCEQYMRSVFEAKIVRFYAPYSFETEFSVHDIDSVMKNYIFLVLKTELEENDKHRANLIRFLTSPFAENDPDAALLIQSVSDELWTQDPGFAEQLVNVMLEYSKFSMSNSFFRASHQGDEALEDYWIEYENMILNANDFAAINSDSAFLKDEENFSVLRHVTSILPTNISTEKIYKLYIKLYKLTISELLRKETRRYREKQDITSLRYTLSKKISNIAFFTDNKLCQGFFAEILNDGLECISDCLKANRKDFYEVYKFIKDILVNIILLADNNLPEDKPDTIVQTIDSFYRAWTTYRNVLIKRRSPLLGQFLFLFIEWRADAKHWPPLQGHKDFYLQLLDVFGISQIQAVINLAAFIGDTVLMIDILRWLIPHLIDLPKGDVLNAFQNIEQLVNRAYENHLSEILGDYELRNGFLSLLDSMIEGGSSDAYWTREFMISFRTTAP